MTNSDLITRAMRRNASLTLGVLAACNEHLSLGPIAVEARDAALYKIANSKRNPK